MEPQDAQKLRLNCTKIVQNIRAKDVIPYLFQNDVLTPNEMETVTLPTLTTEEGMLKLVSLLMKKKGAFVHFLGALVKTDSEWLADELRDTDVTKATEEPNPALEELDKQEKMDLLVKQLNQQTLLIEMLLTKQKSQPQDSTGGKQVLVTEMPELKVAMAENNLSETEVVRYIEYVVTRKSKREGIDQMDSGSDQRRRSLSASSLNFTETVALKTALDIVSYLAVDEENACLPNTKYEATMRRTAREVISMHRSLFQTYMNKIEKTDRTGIEFLFKVADVIFCDNQYNWGRIVVLYAFCGWLANAFSEKVRTTIAEFLGYYVSQKLGPWIDKNGGWDSFLDNFPEETKKKEDFWSFALVGLMIGVGAVASLAVASR